MENRELYHYGIKGMRWGIRRKLNKGGTSSKSGKKKRDDDIDAHEDYKSAHAKSNVKSMSNAELRARINRLQMERQLKDLSKNERSAGSKFVTDVLANAAKETAKNYVAQYMKKGIDAAIKKALSGKKVGG